MTRAKQINTELSVAESEIASPTWLLFLPAIALGLVLFRFRVRIFISPLPLNDFMFYWTGARLFLTHADPYSMPAMFAWERALGWHYEPVALLYPPWVLPLISIFGLFSFDTIHQVWRFGCIAIEAASLLTLWRYFGGSARTAWISLAILATFLPAGSAEQMGQVTPLMLGGLTLFLVLIKRGRYVFAGASLLLLGLKPHLMLLVILAIVLWAIQEKRWSLLAGATGVFTVSTLAAILFNPRALGYFHSTQPALAISCGVGGALRDAFGMQHEWLQFVPTVLGTIWFTIRWIRYRHAWHWEEQMPVVVLVSLATAPYSWAHDYVLALPAIIALAVRLKRASSDMVVPTAIYMCLQLLIFSYLQNSPKSWQSIAGTLWLAYYVFSSSGLEQPKQLRVPAYE